jgi:hypothetical protein
MLTKFINGYIMNIKEVELLQVASGAVGVVVVIEEIAPGAYRAIIDNTAYINLRYALSAVATIIIREEMQTIKD